MGIFKKYTTLEIFGVSYPLLTELPSSTSFKDFIIEQTGIVINKNLFPMAGIGTNFGGRNWTRTSEPEGVDLQSTGIAAIPYDQN